MFVSTPLPDGFGGKSAYRSATRLISPLPLSMTPGVKTVAPNADMNGPSLTEFASTIAGAKLRSNCQSVRSMASAIEIGIVKVSPTATVTKGAEMVVARAVVTLDAIAMAVAVQMPSRFMQSSDAYDGSLDAPRTHQTKRSSFPVFEPTTVTNLSPEKSTPIASVGSSTLDVFDQ